MPSTTSGTTAFTMDVDDIIHKALEPLGGEHVTGISANDARFTLNLVLIELQNKNIPMNKVEYVSVPLIANTEAYTLAPDVVDILELGLFEVTSGFQTPLERWGIKEYHTIPDKTTANRPTLFSTDRMDNNVKFKVWPVPPSTGQYTAQLVVAKRIEDITASYQKVDLSYRYLPLLIKWLAYELSLTRQGIPADVKAEVKQRFIDVQMDTFEEDRERVDFMVKPGGICGR